MSPFDVKTSFNSRNYDSKKELGFDEMLFDAQLDDPNQIESERVNIPYRALLIILLLSAVALFARIYYLQAVRGEEYRVIAEGNKLRNQYILAPRGLILDRYGKTIVSNMPSFEVVAIPNELPEDEADLNSKLNEISNLSGKPVEELKETVGNLDRKSPHPYTLVENLAKDPALVMISRKDDFHGFAVQNNPIRDYKDPLVFAHLTGYTGKITAEELEERQGQDYLLNDYIGKSGLEIQYENYLKGTPGSNQTEINAQGDFNKTLPAVPAIPGKNLKLNIDYELQEVLYDAMVNTMDKTNSRKAAAVATNPQTGQVLALVSLPGYDGNLFARGIKSQEYNALLTDQAIPLLNRTVSGTYPPGSTVKPMLGIAALTEGIVTPHKQILDDGVIRVGSYSFYGYRREGLGLVDLYGAIARSSDIYFYTIGGGSAKSDIKEGLGPDKLAKWYRHFNLGSILGIDLPNEKSGLVPDPEWKERVKNEPWYLGNTYHYSIGQGDLLATPLQINSATATIANGGRIMQPYIVDEISDSEGNLIQKNQPKALKENFFEPGHVTVVRDAMRETVVSGSGRSLSTVPLEIAGKTGTAQFDARDLSATHAWFTSFAPFQDPKIALTVLVEGAGEGSSVSVPISKEVYAWWAQNRANQE
jgi:penicillin-binding protein 2